MVMAPNPDSAVLHRQKHVNYWLRCLKTLLPTEYTSNDSNRMILAFFVLSALDVLNVLHTHTKPFEREQYIEWIYQSQHSEGGFGGSPPSKRETEDDEGRWDLASLPSTYFALATLGILGNDLKRVRKEQCLRWLKRLQRPDGSFGEMMVDGLDERHQIDSGSRDVRYCYWAAGVRWILQGLLGGNSVEGSAECQEDIDVDALVGFIRASEVRLPIAHCSIFTLLFPCSPPPPPTQPQLMDFA